MAMSEWPTAVFFSGPSRPWPFVCRNVSRSVGTGRSSILPTPYSSWRHVLQPGELRTRRLEGFTTSYCWWKEEIRVDSPVEVKVVEIPLFIGFHTSKVVSRNSVVIIIIIIIIIVMFYHQQHWTFPRPCVALTWWQLNIHLKHRTKCNCVDAVWTGVEYVLEWQLFKIASHKYSKC